MPELKCTVQTCMHNKDFYCALDKIQVGGSSAKNAEETCCDSFEERKGSTQNSYGNSAGQTASACSSVDCQATQCRYNDNCQCHAGKISVEGSNACQCGQTECATFKC